MKRIFLQFRGSPLCSYIFFLFMVVLKLEFKSFRLDANDFYQ